MEFGLTEVQKASILPHGPTCTQEGIGIDPGHKYHRTSSLDYEVLHGLPANGNVLLVIGII